MHGVKLGEFAPKFVNGPATMPKLRQYCERKKDQVDGFTTYMTKEISRTFVCPRSSASSDSGSRESTVISSNLLAKRMSVYQGQKYLRIRYAPILLKVSQHVLDISKNISFSAENINDLMRRVQVFVDFGKAVAHSGT